MPEQILRFSPHRDLQCYFFQPSAIAALSNAGASGFTLSGSWRSQWDWAVVEWNRDNVFEHPTLRYLPDVGANNLSGVTLSYVEQRTGCVPLESNTYPSLDWPYLRLWVPNTDGADDVYFVRLSDPEYWTPAAGASYQNAAVTMTLAGAVTAGLRVGLAFMGTFASPSGQAGSPIEQHYYYTPVSGDTTLAAVAAGLAAAINAGSQDISAVSNGSSVVCTYVGSGALTNKTGANANRIGVYGFIQSGSQTGWQQTASVFSGGQFPTAYQMTLPFGNLKGVLADPTQFFAATVPYVIVPTQNVRKVRWTWAADIQPSNYVRTEFEVAVSQWTVTDSNRTYSVAGPGSRRIEDIDPAVTYSSGQLAWTPGPAGNYSGSTITSTVQQGASCTIQYSEPAAHVLYLGTRRFTDAPSVSVKIDGGTPIIANLQLPGEDAMVRIPLGSVPAGTHTVTLTHNGNSPGVPATGPFALYFDFLEIAYPSQNLPDLAPQRQLALATDWDTLHSQALPAERTAWLISKLGFYGRVNHYVGAIWWYELVRPGQQFATLTATITAPANPSGYTEIDFGSAASITSIQHLNLVDDTSATIAEALALRVNQGTTSVWASAAGNLLTLTWRFIQSDPALPSGPLAVASTNPNGNVSVSLSANSLNGGVTGTSVGYASNDAIQMLTDDWRADLTFPLRLNRACRDWSQAFFRALAGYGIDVVAAFSTELAHVDPTPSAGMAQRYPDGSPVVLTTPSIQTNFSPAAQAFWTAVYQNMAALQNAAGITPYLQSGEVQWWYYPDASGMPYYDAYTASQYASSYGGSLPVVTANNANPAVYPNLVALLPQLLANYTAAIRTGLRSSYPGARYEVLYPGDVNLPIFNAAVNFAASDWTPANLTCLKTEGLSFAASRNLDASLACMRISSAKGFLNSQRSHLVGIGDAKTPWTKEVDLAQAEGMESVVLFALDQYCLIGYPAPPFMKQRWSRRAA